MKIPIDSRIIEWILYPINAYSQTVGNSNRMSVICSTTTNNRVPIVITELVSICVQTLELYCNAGTVLKGVSFSDDVSLYPQHKVIAESLLSLSKGSVPTAVYAKVLSCLCGLCRNSVCMDIIVNAFPAEMVSSLINDCENVPAIIRTLFLIYAFIMESKDLIVVYTRN